MRVHRETSHWRDRNRSYDVIFDDVKVGDLRNGADFDLPVSPGAHTLRIKIDWTGSRTLKFAVESAQTAEFICRARPAWMATVDVVRAIWRRDAWVELERIR